MIVERLARALAPAGLNLFGVIDRARFDAAAPVELRCDRLHPPARAIVVIGSGGRAHWDAFLAWVAQDPRARLARSPHPLDTFMATRMAALDDELRGCRVFYPTFRSRPRLDFMRMAELAGLGRPSELGILVHPEYGSWFGLRAAVLTPEPLPDATLAARACDGCPAPCRAPDDLLARREACPVGAAQAYDPLEKLYHHDRRRGRALLCTRFGVTDEIPPDEIH